MMAPIVSAARRRRLRRPHHRPGQARHRGRHLRVRRVHRHRHRARAVGEERPAAGEVGAARRHLGDEPARLGQHRRRGGQRGGRLRRHRPLRAQRGGRHHAAGWPRPTAAAPSRWRISTATVTSRWSRSSQMLDGRTGAVIRALPFSANDTVADVDGDGVQDIVSAAERLARRRHGAGAGGGPGGLRGHRRPRRRREAGDRLGQLVDAHAGGVELRPHPADEWPAGAQRHRHQPDALAHRCAPRAARGTSAAAARPPSATSTLDGFPDVALRRAASATRCSTARS